MTIKKSSVDVNELTLHVKLKACCPEEMGYKTLIFEDLEFKDPDFKYITCIIFPNWNHSSIKLEDEGYVQVRYITAGSDKWFDGKEFVPYKYTNIQFLKFVKIQEAVCDLILD